ncbi:hypothetical protein Ddye_030362 [Dipteronia dyeriana]|uniref:Uncharacterized protein n=1 Tax=Dipteronia dyeriana TaxID=168575 RepID=A0AAD9TG65_9ROSI|nr:hypothetical protein Ddye_030362 [Dipteronia dyeriana]
MRNQLIFRGIASSITQASDTVKFKVAWWYKYYGSAKGNPGNAGIGGVLMDSSGKVLVLFLPHLKPFTFGHPNVNEILQRCLTERDHDITLRQESKNVPYELNRVREQYYESLKRLEDEDKKCKEKSSGTSSGGLWWDDQEIENINELDEL